LGEGSYGTVELVKDKTTNEIFALKRIIFQNKEQREVAEREAKLLKDCDHPNIVKGISYYQDDGFFKSEFGIIMEYCDGGSLVDLIKNRLINRNSLSEPEILSMMLQICHGVAYLHERKIIHRDLKIVIFF